MGAGAERQALAPFPSPSSPARRSRGAGERRPPGAPTGPRRSAGWRPRCRRRARGCARRSPTELAGGLLEHLALPAAHVEDAGAREALRLVEADERRRPRPAVDAQHLDTALRRDLVGESHEPGADPVAGVPARGDQQLDVELGAVDGRHVRRPGADDQRAERLAGALGDHQAGGRGGIAEEGAGRAANSRTRARVAGRSEIGRSPHWPGCPRATIHATASSKRASSAPSSSGVAGRMSYSSNAPASYCWAAAAMARARSAAATATRRGPPRSPATTSAISAQATPATANASSTLAR